MLPNLSPQAEARSLYGATKLASEIFFQEYADTYGSELLINRCGVLAGPGQFGKVDQGVFTLWVANHYFNKSLQYIGFGGTGLQVRDLLHPHDLFSLLEKQIDSEKKFFKGNIFNVGGGVKNSTSLLEMTQHCQALTGHKIAIKKVPETSPVDIPYFVMDSRLVEKTFSWTPKKSLPEKIVAEIHDWLKKNEAELKPLFTS